MTMCQWPEPSNQQNQKTNGGKNESGDGEAAAFVQFRAFADLHKRDDRKNEAENVERKSAAAQISVTDRIPKINPAVAKEFVFAICPPLKFRVSAAQSAVACRHKTIRKFRQQTNKIPVLRAVHKNRRPAFDTIFRDPPPQLFGGDRSVFLAVLPDDFIHDSPFYSSSFSEIARLASVQTPRFALATKSNMIFAVGLLKVLLRLFDRRP